MILTIAISIPDVDSAKINYDLLLTNCRESAIRSVLLSRDEEKNVTAQYRMIERQGNEYRYLTPMIDWTKPSFMLPGF